MDFLTDFGVKPILLLAQIVNFLVLLFLMKKLLYRPLLRVLEERKQKIAESLKNAEEIEKKLARTEHDREEQLKKTAKETEEIIKEAAKSASQIIAQAHEKAGEDIKSLMEKSHQDLRLEREKLQQEMRAELATLVAAGLERVAGKALTGEDQKKLVTKSLEEIHD